jgi:hypothetical protein
MGLCSFPLLMSMPSLEGEVGVQPWCSLPWQNSHCSLSGQSALRPGYGCGGGERSPRAAPPRGREVDPSFFIRSCVELLGGHPRHGS